ncbi:MAG: MmgE/PrpD family protein [Betaproteobacteria bacterium]|nr:MmgE/PrpD family protein [Betaproteobacteria bacterium]
MSSVTDARSQAAARAGAGVTRALARHAATLQFDALPRELVDMIKQCVLDTLGVAIGASTLAPEAAILADYVRDLGGKPEATILGFGGKAPAPWAAFVNGSLGHMLDYDDMGESGHPGIVTIPVALAVAEKMGGVSGRELIAAVAAGTDVMTRLSRAIDVPDWTITEGWFATQLIGFVAGAATAGRLLGLDEEQMENALGIGFNQMSGTRQMAEGAATHMRSMQAGFSGQGAVLAAELARRGIIGSKAFVEGRYGFFRTYIRGCEPDWDGIVDGLGVKFPLLEKHGFKVWPACAYTRTTNAAILALRQQHGLKPGDVESITIVGGTGGTQQLCEPLAAKRRPKVSIDGKFSIPFTTAVMMAKGNVTLRDYTEAGLRDPDVLAMADRIGYRPAAQPVTGKGGSADVSATSVEIVTRDGRTLEHRAASVPGDPKNPVGWERLEAKFRDCVSFSAKQVAAGNVDRAAKTIRALENEPDATAVLGLLA